MKQYIHTFIIFALLAIPFRAHATINTTTYTIPYTVSATANAGPIVTAGPDIALTAPASSTSVTGTATDPDGTIVSTQWAQIIGPDTALIVNPALLTTSITNLTCTSYPCIYVFRLTATDDSGDSAFDDMQVVISMSSPDLIAGTTGPSTATVGTPLTFSSVITNQGGATTGASFQNFFQIATSPTGSGAVDLSATSMTTLASGASDVASSPSYTFSATGSRYIRACADKASSADAGSITESNETNNCGPWTRILISPAPSNTPSVTLSAGPTTVLSGQPTTLSWISENVSSCTANASPSNSAWDGPKPISSVYPHQSSGPISESTMFMITCTGSYGSASSQVRVNTTILGTGSDISAMLTATPGRISLGDSSLLTWSSTNATTCIGQNFDTGDATSGTLSVSPTVDTTYRVKCSNGGSDAIAQTTVTLKRKFLFIEY